MLKKPSHKLKKQILDLFLIKDFSSRELKNRIQKLKSKIIQKDLKYKYSGYHRQNFQKIDDFISSLKNGIKYERLW
jgi:hypothetical protein